MTKQGCFITLEGIEGAGKSTAMSWIQQFLGAQGIDVILTREPGGTPLAEALRALVLTPADPIEPITPTTELLLMFAGRSQHIAQRIHPALAEGQWVLSDRFTDATYAYQGGGRGMDLSLIAQLETLVQGDLRPDLTLIFDVEVESGLRRAKKRGTPDRFETETLDFFERVRENYLSRAQADPDRYVVIDANVSVAAVEDQLQNVLQLFIARGCPLEH